VFVHERGNKKARAVFSMSALRESARDTIRTLRSGHEYPGLLRFLLGRMFYTDAINTVIAYMTLYTVNVAVASGLTEDAGTAKAKLVMFSAITCAIVGGITWGRIVDRQGPKRTLTRVMQLWLVTFSLAAAVGFLHLPIGFLYAVACLAGIAIGGTWTADRPLMLRLTPPHRVGEFYGLYGMVGRFSAITGPMLWWLTTRIASARGASILTGEAFAIVTLLAMVIVSMVILKPVNDRQTPAV
jgi:UMF1 family MFS transporter